MKYILYLTLFLFFVAQTAIAAEMSIPAIADHETGKQEKRFVKNGKLIMEVSFTHDKVQEEGRTLIKRKVDAVWHLTKKPVPFVEESVIEVTESGLRTLTWRKDSYGDENETWTTTYDWTARKIHTTWKNRDSGKSKKDTVDMEDGVICGDSFELALRGFPFDKGEGHSLSAKLLSPQGSFQKGTVTFLGTKTIETVFGKMEVYKLEVDPGILPTITYYLTKKAPHILVFEEGLEFAGILPKKANQKMLSFEPADWVKQ